MSGVGQYVGQRVGQRTGQTLGRASLVAPDAPTIGLATAGNGEASVAFTPAVGGSPATSYTVTSTPGGFTATGAASPLVVTGPANGTAYTFTVHASNAAGDSAESAATGSIMPLWLWGVYPLWHHSSTTPNADGAISAIADMSLSLYPASQGTGGSQPIRGSGKITFDGTDDIVGSAAAALCAFPDSCHAWEVGFVGDLDSATPGTAQAIAAWGATGASTNFAYCRHSTGDKMTVTRSTTTSVVNTSTANMDATRAAYIARGEGGVLQDTVSSYKNGTIQSTATNGAVANGATDRFSFGGYQRTTAANFFNGAIVALYAMDRISTAGEIAQWTAYSAAGSPPRSA